MTDDEVLQITLDHWKMNYPKEYKALGENALKEARTDVKMTRWEMDILHHERLTHFGIVSADLEKISKEKETKR